MFKKIKELIGFLKNVAQDPRIPTRDKATILVFIALLVSPVDIIPDWIPVLGQLDDLIIVSLVLDYFFEVLSDEILMAHYPWSQESFYKLKKYTRWVARQIPGFVKRRLWKFHSEKSHGDTSGVS